jgi:type VI secretion system protein ImpJ
VTHWDNRVLWSEGMFLRPQHFQQQDRYVDKLLREFGGALAPYGWGVARIELNRELLAIGKFAVTSLKAVMPDGTIVNVPDDVDHPPPLEVARDARDMIVYLTVPARQAGAVEFDPTGGSETAARYVGKEFEAVDTGGAVTSPAVLQVGRLRLGYALGRDQRAGLVSLGLARIAEVRAEGAIVLDETYIPPCLSVRASRGLSAYLAEMMGLIQHRAKAFAAVVSGAGGRTASDISQFLMLQVLNRHEPLLAHLSEHEALHPERVYAVLVALAGELATFTNSETRRPPAFPPYRHDELLATFLPVMQALRTALSAPLEQPALRLPLEEKKYGIRVAIIPEKTLLTTAGFVLAVKAEMPSERLRRVFPQSAKFGPVEGIANLVNAALPGIEMRAMEVAPRQIPFNRGATYFELETHGPLWKQLETSGGLARFVPDGYPQLELELWAIRKG